MYKTIENFLRDCERKGFDNESKISKIYIEYNEWT